MVAVACRHVDAQGQFTDKDKVNVTIHFKELFNPFQLVNWKLDCLWTLKIVEMLELLTIKIVNRLSFNY